MAVTAKFIADFTSFQSAVDKAEVKLRSFESGAASVEKQLARVGDSFSGRRVLQEATLAAKAVENIGGVTKLTAAEQQRLNATVSEALAKYKALGLTAPRELLEIEQATRKVDDATGGISTKMIAIGTAVGTFIGSLAVDAVKALGRQVVDLATNGIKLAPIVSSFERLTASIGQSGEAMLAVTRTATKGLVKDLDIMQAANKAILLGLPVTAQEFGNLASAATALGRAMGQDATKSLDDLITALGRSSPLILDNLGLTVKVGEANEKYAKSLGKTANDLTDAEKKLAFYNAAVDAAKVKMEALGGVQLTLADQLARIRVGFTNFTDALGVAIARSPVLNEVLGSVADAMEGAFGDTQVSRVQNLIQVLNQAAIRLVDFGKFAVDVALAVTKAYEVLADTVALNFDGMFKAILRSQRLTIDALLAGAAVARQFDPTGIADRNFKLLLAMRAAMDATTTSSTAFGKTLTSASDSLGALRARLVELAKVQVQSGDIAADLTRKTKDLGTTTGEMSEKTKKAADALFGRDVIEKATEYAKAIGNVGNVSKLSVEKQKEVHAVVNEAIQAYQRLGQIAPKVLIDLAEATFKTQVRTVDFSLAMRAVPPAVEDMADEARRATNQLRGLTEDGFLPSARAIAITVEQIYAVPPALETTNRAVTKTNGVLKTLRSSLDGLNDIFQAAFEGGGGVGGAISSLATDITEGLLEMIPVVGKVLSKFSGAIVSGFKAIGRAIFGGPSEQELEGREAARNFRAGIIAGLTPLQRETANTLEGSETWRLTIVGLQDAYRATGRTAEEALEASNRLWRAERQGAEAVQRVMEEIQGVFDEQRADVERLDAAVQKYGFTLEELGPALRNQRLNEQAKELIEDWRVLVGSGIDLSLVNERMAESVNAYLQAAIKTGSEVPFAFRPILQSLADQGKLVDASGNAINSLEEAGITFAETMTQGFDRVVIKLQQLIETLQGAGQAIANLPAIDVPVNVPDIEGSLRSRFGGFGNIRAMASGGVGTVTQPTLFMAGEAGPESFAFSGANKGFAATDVAGLRDELRELRADMARQQRDLPRALKIAMQDAFALAS